MQLTCNECQVVFSRIQSRSKTSKVFCSRSCSTRHNNRIVGSRRKPQGSCLTCSSPIIKAHRYCVECRPILGNDMTIEEAMYTHLHKSSAFALIRTRARTVARELGLCSCCCNCGYDKHVEIAHRRAISSFPLTTLVSVVNDAQNLIPLCPNCHWEFDNGLLSL